MNGNKMGNDDMDPPKQEADDSESKDSESVGGSSSANSTSRGSQSGFSRFGYDDFSTKTLGRFETQALSCAKIFVVVFLLGLAGGISYLWFVKMTENEENIYQEDFVQYADRITDVFLGEIESRILTSASLAATFTSYVENSPSMAWPQVSFDNFERRAAGSRSLARATAVWYSPFVAGSQRGDWESYAKENEDMLKPNLESSASVTADDPTAASPYKQVDWSVGDGIFFLRDTTPVAQGYSGIYAPIWQSAPYETTKTIAMFNQVTDSFRTSSLKYILVEKSHAYSQSQLVGTDDSIVMGYTDGPHVSLYTPIFGSLSEKNANVTAGLVFDMAWKYFFDDSANGVPAPLAVIIENTCGQAYTFEVGDSSTDFLAEGSDVFSSKLNLRVETTFEQFDDVVGSSSDSSPEALCSYRIIVSPTQDFQNEYLTSTPLFSALGVAGIFILTVAVFILYDCVVERRQRRVTDFARRTNAIVRSLFPAAIRERVFLESKNGKGLQKLPEGFSPKETPKLRLKNYLNDGTASSGPTLAGLNGVGSEPIADFWPNTTILYADLSGFTAWSSTREPSQVFTLLETLYGAMDKAARRLGVFKVETVGDCYVAATGLPDPRDDHAVLMARFAHLCLTRVSELTRSLEAALGPGTGDLAMRVGIHSGPVTAGVLRGEKSRFQLFGDTMAVAAHMEKSGIPNKIHLSKETADLLKEADRAHWIQARADVVRSKERGSLETFWLVSVSNSRRHDDKTESDGTSETSSNANSDEGIKVSTGTGVVFEPERNTRLSKTSIAGWNDADRRKRMDRLVEWNVEILGALLRQIVAYRRVKNKSRKSISDDVSYRGKIALDEVKEVIEMPDFQEDAAIKMAAAIEVELSEDVKFELRDYVQRIASFYEDNPFHNFEHASHVCLSANKLLKRIVTPDGVDYRLDSNEEEVAKYLAVAADLHEVTYGLSSDPVAQFAVVFSALIHDAGHTGVPNFVLAKEEPDVAEKYRNTSIAEQRSVDLAWDLLMNSSYENLRACLFPTSFEIKHFRQLIVNCVLATDIFDQKLSKLRKARWQKVFHPDAAEASLADLAGTAFDRKSTIVIEHIIQASDVAHTMQHWHVYQKWNERLFQEMYASFRAGRCEKDPSEGWYKGELWFFDNYVIPLAHKLKECGCFGVSSSEYLNYAVQNREEWELKGQGICDALVANFEASRFNKV